MTSARPVSALAQVLARIDPDEVVELTRALVRIPSVFDPDVPKAVAHAISGGHHHGG